MQSRQELCALPIHLNAMQPLYDREPSLIGTVTDKNTYIQVICDGTHIHPVAIKII